MAERSFLNEVWHVFPTPGQSTVMIGPVNHNNLVRCRAQCYMDELDVATELTERWNAHNELLAACERIAERRYLVDDDADERDQMVATARDAITKAKGNTQ